MSDASLSYDQLKLENQLCFPVYAASRLITREYQPLLDRLGLTYPQYLVLMVLWEKDGLTVNQIAHTLILNTNTVTPLLKRMEAQGLLRRNRSAGDERKVLIRLTEKGRSLRDDAASIPEQLARGLMNGPMDLDQLLMLRDSLHILIRHMQERTLE
ncbi:MAG: MarR family transcriptional regulator [Bacteroidales bacterium]